MENFKTIFLITFLFISCGKSPLLMQKKEREEVVNQSSLEATRTFSTSGHQVNLIWLTPINSMEEGHFLLISKKDNFASDLPENFSLFLWMVSMGHGSSPVIIKKIATGVYDVSEVYFIMDGLWQIRLQLKNSEKILEEVNFSYNL